MPMMSHRLVRSGSGSAGGAEGVGCTAGDASDVTPLGVCFGLVCYAWPQRHKSHPYVFGFDLQEA